MELKIVVHILLYLVLPIIIIKLFYSWFYKKGLKNIAKIFITLCLAFFSYNIYTAFFPNESFYIEEYEINTNLNFPKNVKFISKYASYPDIHGDYISICLVQLSATEFYKLYNKVVNDSSFIADESIYCLNYIGNKISEIEKNNIIKIVRKNGIQIGFINNQQKIIISKIS
jgi:hypothetical protein